MMGTLLFLHQHVLLQMKACRKVSIIAFPQSCAKRSIMIFDDKNMFVFSKWWCLICSNAKSAAHNRCQHEVKMTNVSGVGRRSRSTFVDARNLRTCVM